MKLASLETFTVGNPPPGFGGRYFIFVRLRTACGLTGIGEIYSAAFGPAIVCAMARDVFDRYLADRSPSHIERFWHRAHGSGFTHRPDSAMQAVISGLEMACWDIVGKACDQPVYELLGGKVHERLRSYTYLYPTADQDPGTFYNDAHASAEAAAACVQEGFTAVKFDPAGQYTVFDGRMPDLEAIERSAEFCRLIRQAVGTRADLLFGTHGQFTAAGAIRVAKQLEAFDPLWFEEPTPPDMPEEMAKVARATSIPVATGERLCSKFEFARVLNHGAAAILQPNLGRAGGILEAKKIAAMAEASYAQIAPHLYCGPVVAAANIQLATCTPNFLIAESIGRMDGFHASLLKTPLQWEDGYLIPPTTAGLGVELDDSVVAAHPLDGDQLHLEMGQDPYDPVRDRLFPGG
ncbi:MAG: mandelate racemase/muconate lactonizing enzyme family protein [Candidatus Puniceispirillaceae bacterium]